MLWPHKWLIYVLCGTELDTANAVDNNCMNWNKDREVGIVGGCSPSLQSTGTVTWSDRKDLCMFHTTNTYWWRRMRKPHPSPIYAVRSASLTLLSDVKSDLRIELWTLYLIHVVQSVQKNIFIHSMHNNDLQNMQRSFSYFLFSNFLSSTKCFTALSRNMLQNIILWQYI